MPDISQNPGLYLKVIFIVHFTLTALSSIGYWSSAGYVFYNFVFILLLLWEIKERTGQSLQLAVIVNINCVIIDILLLVMGFPGSDSAREKFSVAMAILQLIVRPVTTILLAKIAFQSTTDEGLGNVFTRENIGGIFSGSVPVHNGVAATA